MMNWSSDPPRISGWWFVGAKVLNHNAITVHVIDVREHYRRWQWRYINWADWRSCEDYPKHKWAGPILEPSLENFNRAK